MSRRLATALLLATTCLAKPLLAQQPAQEAPRDKDGVRGISPFWESINKGSAAFLAQDLGGAADHFRAAITHSPKNPVGHLRMAEVSLKLNELDRAQEFISAALRFSEDDLRQRIFAFFLLAELRERKRAHDDAIDAWRNYKALNAKLPPNQKEPKRGPKLPHVYVETADSRIAAIEARKKLETEYAAVRQRIQENIDKADSVTGAGASKKDD